MKKILSIAWLAMLSSLAQAQINIAATVPNMGMLASEIGGDAVDVTVMAPADRDPHYLEARPNMMAAIRNADMVVAVGGELEVGWLPAALQGAGNPGVREGQPGYFEGAAHVALIGKGAAADRSQGDVHPGGNPHFYLDPERMAQAGYALAERLAGIDSENADAYYDRAEAFEQAVAERLGDWQARTENAPGVVMYHKDANYLMDRMGVDILGYLEPLPGVPPTAQHLSSLVQDLQGREAVVLYTDFQPSRGAEFMERQLGWSHYQLASQVEPGSDREAYFQLIDRWVEALSP